MTTMRFYIELIKSGGWLDKTPIIRVGKIDIKRIRWLTKEENNLLLKELPPHLEAMASLTLVMDLSESSVMRLKWVDINVL